jgi:flagellar hook-associated protein 3 FlgL
VRQLNSDQLAIAKLQTQISTGRRVFLPSDDAPAALRGIAIQQLLERKQQAQVNLNTGQSYLSATDAALANVSNMLSSIRGTALGVADTGASDEQRAAAALEVDRAIQELLDIGNQKFRGRHLFSGSLTTQQPFGNTEKSVIYNGNELRLQSYADTDMLFQTNVDGNAVFGALSVEVRGTVDLNPRLTEETLLADLRGGEGIAQGSVLISDGPQQRVVDLSTAATVGDVKRLLEANPPPGRTVSVDITSTGLSISLDGGGGGDLTIQEVGGGTTANDLGILRENGAGTGPFVGDDLNPSMNKLTPLADLLNGASFDQTSGLRITVGEDVYDVNFATATTVEDVLNRINGSVPGVMAELNAAGNGINLRAAISGVDFTVGENGGTTAADLGLRSHHGGTQLSSLNHGLGVNTAEGIDFFIRRKDGVQFGVDVSSAVTVQDVIDLINNHPDNQDPAHRVLAGLVYSGNGISLSTSDVSTGATLAVIKTQLSHAANDLGLIPAGAKESSPASSAGGVDTIAGRDTAPLEVGGAFTALLRLRDALRANDGLQISRAIEVLDTASVQLNYSRSELGARQQSLDLVGARLTDEMISLEATLSDEIDVDLAQAISELVSKQASYQATLQTTGMIARQSLLDFL